MQVKNRNQMPRQAYPTTSNIILNNFNCYPVKDSNIFPSNNDSTKTGNNKKHSFSDVHFSLDETDRKEDMQRHFEEKPIIPKQNKGGCFV